MHQNPVTSISHFDTRPLYEKDRRIDLKRPSEKQNGSLRKAILEGKRTAFDEHIEQVERLRQMIRVDTKSEQKGNWYIFHLACTFLESPVLKART